MVDYKIIKTNIINNIKPFCIHLFLILNEIQLLPREVNWIIIDYYFNNHDQMLKLQHDEKVIIFTDVYYLTVISFMSGDDLKFNEHGLDKNQWMVIIKLVCDMMEHIKNRKQIDESQYTYDNIPDLRYQLDLYDYINLQKVKYNLFNQFAGIKNHFYDMLTVDRKYINL